MNEPDIDLRTAIRRGQNAAEAGRTTDFDAVWAGAEARVRARRRRNRLYGGLAVAATALIAAFVGLQRPATPEWQFVDPDQFASSTSWVAPSDVLLPEHRFDIYAEIPVLIESTAIDEGALL